MYNLDFLIVALLIYQVQDELLNLLYEVSVPCSKNQKKNRRIDSHLQLKNLTNSVVQNCMLVS